MNMYEMIQRMAYSLKDDRYAWYDRLRSHASLSRTELLQLRDQYCRDLLFHAYDTVPFYHGRFRDCGIGRDDIVGVATLDLLPPLSKADLREHEGNIKSTDPVYRNMTRVTSGGSTGELSVTWRSRRYSAVSRGCAMRNWALVDWFPGDKALWFWGAPYEHEMAVAGVVSRCMVHIKRQCLLNTYSFNPSSFPEWFERASRFKPKVVYGYAKVLEVFAEYMCAENLRLPTVRVVVSSVEKLEARERIQQAFGAPVFDQYGCREILGIGIETAPHKMVIADDCVVIRTEKRVSEITALHSYGFPLINYQLGDVITIAKQMENDEQGGLPFTIADLSIGRETDYFIAGDGSYVSASAMSVYVSQQGHSIAEQQFLQLSPSEFEIRYVPGDNLNEAHYQEDVCRILREYFGPGNQVRFLLMDYIPPEPSGKKLMFKRLFNS